MVRFTQRGDVLKTSAFRGEGGSENLPILQMNSTDRLREMQMKGEGGQKFRKYCRRLMFMPPYLQHT